MPISVSNISNCAATYYGTETQTLPMMAHAIYSCAELALEEPVREAKTLGRLAIYGVLNTGSHTGQLLLSATFASLGCFAAAKTVQNFRNGHRMKASFQLATSAILFTAAYAFASSAFEEIRRTAQYETRKYVLDSDSTLHCNPVLGSFVHYTKTDTKLHDRWADCSEKNQAYLRILEMGQPRKTH